MGYYDDLYHSGVKNQKWGIRRYQNEDGSLTPLGRTHYGVGKRLRKKKIENEPKKRLKDYKHIDAMSDEELKNSIARLKAEEDYRKYLTNKAKYLDDLSPKKKAGILAKGAAALTKGMVKETEKVLEGLGKAAVKGVVGGLKYMVDSGDDGKKKNNSNNGNNNSADGGNNNETSQHEAESPVTLNASSDTAVGRTSRRQLYAFDYDEDDE